MRANFDGHLVDAVQAFPPFVTGSQGHFTNNLSGGSMGQGKRTIWTPGNVQKELMFTLRQARKGTQAAIGLETIYKGWWAEIA